MKKRLGLGFAILMACILGSVNAHAIPSTCAFGTVIECDFYESSAPDVIQLDRFVVTGSVGIYDAAASAYRDALRFFTSFGNYFVAFTYPSILQSGYNTTIARTGSLTTYNVGNIYRVHHDRDPAAVPEPGTLTLLGAGLLGLVALRRRRQAS